jgi:hypothetical protein
MVTYEDTWDELDLSKLIANRNSSSFGSYRYNSAIPLNTTGFLAIPEPSSAMLLTLLGGYMAFGRRFSGKRTRLAEQDHRSQPAMAG